MAERRRLTPGEAAELLERYRRMVWFIAKKIRRRFPWVEEDDVAGEVQLAFVDACRNFDPDGPAPFALYARKAGVRAGMAYCRRELHRGMFGARRDNRGDAERLPVVSLDATPSAEGSLADSVPAREPNDAPADQDGWWRVAVAGLTERQRDAIQLYYRDGLSQTEIADRWGTSQSHVWQTLRRALVKLRKNRTSPGWENAVRALEGE